MQLLTIHIIILIMISYCNSLLDKVYKCIFRLASGDMRNHASTVKSIKDPKPYAKKSIAIGFSKGNWQGLDSSLFTSMLWEFHWICFGNLTKETLCFEEGGSNMSILKESYRQYPKAWQTPRMDRGGAREWLLCFWRKCPFLLPATPCWKWSTAAPSSGYFPGRLTSYRTS